MGLIHWWPLNGNLNDYGLLNTPLINSGATVNSSGKIGSCYSFVNTSHQYLYFNDSNFMNNYINNHSFSLACWVKTNGAGGTTLFGLSYGVRLMGSSPSLALYNSSRYTTVNSNTNIADNTWHHVCASYNVTNNEMKIYIDGTLKGTASYPAGYTYSSSWNNANGIGRDWNDSADGYFLNGSLNDIRIYDHALSAKEVKEISKCLVLHYTFEDDSNISPNIFDIANYLSTAHGMNTGTKATYSSSGFTITATGNDMFIEGMCYSLGATANSAWHLMPVEEGKTYRISYDLVAGANLSKSYVCYFNSSRVCVGASAYTGFSFVRYGTTNTYYYDFTVPTGYSITSVSFRIGKAGSSGEVITAEHWQLRKGTAIVGYTPPDFSDSKKVIDSSGYGNNGTLSNNNALLVNDSVSGKYAVQLSGTTISHPRPVDGGTNQEWTVSAWVYPTATTANTQLNNFNNGNRIYHGAGGNALLYLNDGTNDYYNYSNAVLPANQWSLVTFVFKNSNATKLIYYNGVNKTNTGGPNKTSTPRGINDTVIAFTNFTGKIADYKIYATALSADDVLKEYQRKAAVDKNGNLFTGEIVEVKSQQAPQIDKNNYVKASTISEGLMTKMLSDGATFERIYYFDYDKAGSVWTSATAKSCNTTGKFSVLGSLNSYVPIDGWYEFYYRENNNWVRWKQSYNPLSRVTSGTSGSSSEYTYIGGSANPYSSFSGLTRYTSDDSGSCYLRGAPSWWCAIAPYGTSYDVFPDMWGNSTNNHHQELWIRIDNLKAAPSFNDNKFKLNSTGIMTNSIQEL